MAADRIYLPRAELAGQAHCASMEQYRHMHERSVVYIRLEGLIFFLGG